MIARELMLGYLAIDRYMARRARQSKSPELFDNEGNARWITIGAEQGADGKKHGGHPVKISGDGKMLTGKFAGKTMSEAFGVQGDKKEPEKDSKPTEKKRWWHDKELLDVYNKWIERQESKIKKIALRPLSELLSEIRKRGSELERKRDTDEYDKAYRELHQQVRVGQQKLPPEDSQLLSKVFNDWFPAPDDYEEDKVVDLDKWRKENPEPRVVDPESKPEPKQPEQPPGDGIPRVTQDQLGDGSNGTYDQMHAGLASEFVQSRIAKGMEGIENREYAIFQHPSGKWQMVSRKRQKADQKSAKPVEQSKPASQPEALSNPEPESAASTFGKTISSGGTPREAAKAAQKKLDEDYVFARASEVGNAGEDLKGSARHKVNAWRGLEQAEKDGNAEKLVTRDSLLKLEPTNFVAKAQDKPLLSLAMHFAMRSFPAKPGTRNGSPEKNRKEFLEAYKEIKSKAEELVERHQDTGALDAMRELQAFVGNKIKNLRGQKGNDSLAVATATDSYNQTANDLIGLHRGLSPYSRTKLSVGGRFNEFVKQVERKYGTSIQAATAGDIESKKSYFANVTKHAQDIIEGASLNDSFGNEKKSVRRFDPSEAYVKYAKREGGRDVSKITADPNKAVKHMVDDLGIRGVQWGNSVTDDERKHHAGKVVEAITDLADVVGLHPKDFSLGGKLGLAIGARGKGNASAHYEPGSKVINLTRASGVGALAHEWGHAFDHMLADFKTNLKDSSYMSENSEFTHEIVDDSTGRSFDVPNNAKPHKGFSIREKSRSDVRKAYNSWKESCKPYKERLRKVLQEEVRNGTMSHKKASEYWNSGREIFARTFERHVKHKLEEDGRQNTYLSGLGGDHPLWPNAEEAKAMAPAFDAIFEAYRQEKYGSPEKVKFSRLAVIRDLMMLWGLAPVVEHYARKSPKSSPGQMTFDDQDSGRWITIGGEHGADGGKHGGHPVYIGEDGEMKTGKFAGKTLGEAFGGKSKSLHEMSQEELANHINSQKGNSLSHTWEEDWGNTMRGQGKRVKGMVRGGMASVPQGKKTYTSIIGKLEGEERREAGLLETHEQHAYVKAREAGIPHEHAMTWAWEHAGDPDFKGLTLKGIKESAGGGKSPEQTTGASAKSTESNRLAKQSNDRPPESDIIEASQKDAKQLSKQIGKNVHVARVKQTGEIVAISDEQTSDPRVEVISSHLAEQKPGITLDTRSNESAKANDQMGLFGDVANVPRGPATLPPGGESKGKQQSLFDTKGDPDQMMMFDDGHTPDDRLMKFGRSESIREHATELVRYWGNSIDRYSAPSEAQREAGNYPKKHIRLHGLDISIETAKGQRRRPEWPPMPSDYGYIRGTIGKDKDHVDVFIGPNKKSELVVVVDQVDQNGKFDEHKVLLGFSNEASAISQYKKAYTAGWKVGPVTVMTIGQFKSWLKDGSQSKPLERQVSKFSSRSSMVPA